MREMYVLRNARPAAQRVPGASDAHQGRLSSRRRRDRPLDRAGASVRWYADDTIPTWNHVTLHVRGTPAICDDAMAVLRRPVDEFESVVPRQWSLDRIGETAREMAGEVVAFRLVADWWHAEAKLSQDKPHDEQERVLAGLESPGPYSNAPLAALMRRLRRS